MFVKFLAEVSVSMKPRVLNFETCPFTFLVLIHISKHVCKKYAKNSAKFFSSRGGPCFIHINIIIVIEYDNSEQITNNK